MASLYKRKGQWYISYYSKGKRIRISTDTQDKKLAQVKFDDLKVKLFKGELGIAFSPPQKSSVRDFFQRFIEFARNNYTQTHLQSDLSRIKIFQEFLARKGAKTLDSINPGLIEEFMTRNLNGRKPKTRKNYLTLIKTMLNYAVKWGVLDSNPIITVASPKIVKTFHFFSKREINLLIEAAQEPLKTAIIILANTGMRRAELFNLRWRDVDMKLKRFRVWPYEGFTPKGKRPRSIPLNKIAFDAFSKLKRERGDSEYAFRPYNSIFTLHEQFSGLLEKNNMKGTLHDLRHTFASHLAMAGISIPIIKELLGHSDIATTMIYAHLSPEEHQAAIDKLEY